MQNRSTGAAGMAGTLATRAEPHHPIYGKQNLYQAYVEVARDSGVKDSVLVIFQKSVQYRHGAAADIEDVKPGNHILVTGKVQTYKDYGSGRVVLFVLADYIGVICGSLEQQNGVRLEGEIAKETVFRTTPLGKKITEIVLKVPSEFAEGYSCKIPIIAWGINAEAAAGYKIGDKLIVEGRIQSREYIKRCQDGQEKSLVAYEVSASKVEKE